MISTIVTIVTTTQVINYSIISVIALIALLVLKEILRNESGKNKRVKSFVEGSNIAIVPLTLVFVSIVAYKVVTVV